MMTLVIPNVMIVVNLTFNIIVKTARSTCALIAILICIKEELNVNIIDLELTIENHRKRMMNLILASNTQVKK